MSYQDPDIDAHRVLVAQANQGFQDTIRHTEALDFGLDCAALALSI